MQPTSPAQDTLTTIASVFADRIVMSEEQTLAFTAFVQKHDTFRWLLFSDYVLNQPGKAASALAFTLVPGGNYWATAQSTFARAAKRDFKNTKVISPEMLALLGDQHIFTVCFTTTPKVRFFSSHAEICDFLDREIALNSQSHTHPSRAGYLRKMRALREKTRSRSPFNIGLFNQQIVASTIAAFLAYQISKRRLVHRFGWFSDRDNITSAHAGIAYDFFAQSSSDFHTNTNLIIPRRPPEIGVVEEIPGKVPWADQFTRVPDHFAGTVAGWDLDKNEMLSDGFKYRQVAKYGIADNPNFALIRLEFPNKGGPADMRARPFTFRGLHDNPLFQSV